MVMAKYEQVADFNRASGADLDDLPGDFGPAYPEPECWGEHSYEHYRGECRHFEANGIDTCEHCAKPVPPRAAWADEPWRLYLDNLETDRDDHYFDTVVTHREHVWCNRRCFGEWLNAALEGERA